MSDSDNSGCPVAHKPIADADAEDLLSYGSYLKIPQLLDLQQLESDPPAHDELLFITIHQAYELWFKLVVFELDHVGEAMGTDDPYEASRMLQRVLKIEELLIDQIHILETMTPRDFLSFREALNPASGFQSWQFREIEFMTGLRDGGQVLDNMQLDDAVRRRLRERLDEPSLRTQLYQLLGRVGYDVDVPPEDGELEGQRRQQVLDGLYEIYEAPEHHHHIYTLCESLVSHDQNILMWRFHHVRVVERLIGTKSGTGGSAGVDYLSSTLDKRAYPLLWAVRGKLNDQALYGTERGKTEPTGL